MEQLIGQGEVTPFELGSEDSSDQFQIPEKLYGRDADIKHLNTVFNRVSRGASEILLVNGYSGIGKSFLVNEIKAVITRANGFFVSGKFNQFKRHVPYDALIQALKQLMHQLLTESEQSIRQWQERIQGALEPNGQALIDVIPELELIIGKQPALAQLPPLETQNRFQMAMQNLIGVFTRQEHPFVLFFDDLQWADQASLNMIEYIMSDPNTAYLMFVGTFRKNEVSASDRLMVMIDELRQKAVPVTLISLKPLQFQHVHQLVSDTLQSPPERTEALARLVMKKTNGNPFFTKQFLESLYKQGLISRDYASGRWRWDLQAIEGMGITDNVVEFMLAKIKKLPERLQHLLQVASCLGSSFAPQALAFALNSDLRDIAADLQQAAGEDVVVPEGKAYRWMDAFLQGDQEFALIDHSDVSFRFLHDRVQQAAYSLLSEQQRIEFHLKIGRWMLASGTLEQHDDQLFDMVNHFNQARTLITDTAERYEVVCLNLEAARRAKASTAYEQALNDLQHAVHLLPEDAWESRHELAYALHLELSEVQYLCGQFETAEQSFNLLLTHARTAKDKAAVYKIQMILHANQGRYEQVVQVGADAVALLGVKVPKKISYPVLIKQILEIQWRLRGVEPEQLLQRPMMTDPDMREAMDILLTMGIACYIVDPNLCLSYNLEIIKRSLDHGCSAATWSGFMSYAIYLGSFLGKYDIGDTYGKLALQMDEKFHPHTGATNKSIFSSTVGIVQWRHHARETIPLYKVSYQKSLEAGDLVHAVYAVTNLLHNMLVCGYPLDEIHQEAEKYLDFVKRVNVWDTTYTYLMHRALVSNLKGLSADPHSLNDDQFEEEHFRELMFEPGMHHTRGFYFYNKLKVLYLRGEFGAALEMGEQADAMDGHFIAQLRLPENDFYYALTMTALYPDVPPARQRQFFKKLQRLQKQMNKWAQHCPANFLHKSLLIGAELAAVTGRVKEAMTLYDQAIESANLYQFVQNAAIASECAARFHIRRGKWKIAKPYMIEAHDAYLNWGATTKARDLADMYPQLMANETDGKMSSTLTRSKHRTQTLMRTGQMRGHGEAESSVDLMTVLKSTRAISGEIVLTNLLESLIHTVAEQSGAQKAVLLIERDGELYVEGEMLPEEQVVRLSSPPIPYQERHDLPQSVIQYVRRTQEDVLLADSAQSVIFAQDPYIINEQPRSLLCMPVQMQGRLVAVLYLENNWLTHAFTEERLEVLTLLSSQIAVSLEHAGLYRQQVLLTEAYQRFVPDQFLRFLQKKSITDVQLGDYVQTEMSVLFSKVQGFAEMTERMTAEGSFTFLNDYLSRMEPLVTENGGFIDKYIRDSIMSLFEHEADDAVRAAIAMLRDLQVYNARCLLDGTEPIHVGLGINTGTLMLGTLGGTSRMDSTVISDAVNLASRIEGLTEVYGVSVLISEHTYSRLQDPARYGIRIIDRLTVRGKSEPVSIYEVYDADPAPIREAKQRTQTRYQQAYELYHAGSLAEAERLFRECVQINPADPVVQLYLQRCIQPESSACLKI